jgi:hypothetical protein
MNYQVKLLCAVSHTMCERHLTNQAHPQPVAAAVERNQKEQMKNNILSWPGDRLSRCSALLDHTVKTKFSSWCCNLITRIIFKGNKSWVGNRKTRKTDEPSLAQTITNILSLAWLTRNVSCKLIELDHIIPVTKILERLSGYIVELDDWRRILQLSAQLSILDLKLRYANIRLCKLIRENTKLRRLHVKQVLFNASGCSDGDDVSSDVERIYIHNGGDVMRANL